MARLSPLLQLGAVVVLVLVAGVALQQQSGVLVQAYEEDGSHQEQDVRHLRGANHVRPQANSDACRRTTGYTSVPTVRSLAAANHRAVLRPSPWVGLGHRMELFNAALRSALLHNLSLIAVPLNFGHGPFDDIDTEKFFGFNAGLPTTEEVGLDNDGRLRSSNKYKAVTFPPQGSSYAQLSRTYDAPFAELVASKPESHTLFDMRMPGFTDQDWNWSVTGGWFREQYKKTQPYRTAQLTALGKQLFERKVLNIAVHIRRGDTVSMSHIGLPHAYYVTAVNDVLDLIDAGHFHFIKTAVHIFTDGVPAESAKLGSAAKADAPEHQPGAEKRERVYVNERGELVDIASHIHSESVTVHTDESMPIVFDHFVQADILITGISMFSNFAGAIAENVHVAHHETRGEGPRRRASVNSDGHVNRQQFVEALDDYLNCFGREKGLIPASGSVPGGSAKRNILKHAEL